MRGVRRWPIVSLPQEGCRSRRASVQEADTADQAGASEKWLKRRRQSCGFTQRDRLAEDRDVEGSAAHFT